MKTPVIRCAAAAIGLAVGLAKAEGPAARPPAVAGAFYERLPVALEAQVDAALKSARGAAVRSNLVAAVVPHAGYMYSARCAAAVYSQVASGRYERVVVLAPPHRALVAGISLPDASLSAYSTPLGNVEVDRAVCDDLRKRDGFATVPGADEREHAIEVQLPFLQKTVGRFKLVPLLCGAMSARQVADAAGVLAGYAGSNTLFVASSDFTHYGPNYQFVPFADSAQERLRAWLKDAGGRVAALDRAGFERHCRDTGDTICGATPIRLLMATLARSSIPVKGEVLATALSGDVSGDYDNSVSYAAIGFYATTNREEKTMSIKEHKSGTWTPGLTDDEKRTLFALARDTLKWCVEGSRGAFPFDRYAVTPLMKTNMATFVTLKIDGALRGCIGSLAPVAPLYESVHDNAVNAALRDPRFSPVRSGELAAIEVDVSILSPIRDIKSLDEFKLGQHGIIIEKGGYRAVYLPEVATEQGWTVEQTLSSLSMKAGLPQDAWKQGARFKVFESVVLSE